MKLFVIALLSGGGYLLLVTMTGDISLSLAVLGAFFLGFCFSWVTHSFGFTRSVHTTGSSKEKRELEEQRDVLRKKLKELAIENSRLEEENQSIKSQDMAKHDENEFPKRSIFERFDHYPLV